jgi:hypothetical protein
MNECICVYVLISIFFKCQMVSAAPKVDSTVEAVCRMLRAHGHMRACFVAHSLGTTLLAWMLHSEEGQFVRRKFFFVFFFHYYYYSHYIECPPIHSLYVAMHCFFKNLNSFIDKKVLRINIHCSYSTHTFIRTVYIKINRINTYVHVLHVCKISLQ